jgi:two-component system, NarL family, response regulator NreC
LRPYRVLVCHGSAILRRGLIEVLVGPAELEVVGDVADARELLEAACRLHPDVVVADIGILGEREGLSGELLRLVPGVAILTLSSTGSLLEATHALCDGTSGYMLDEEEPEFLVAAVVVAAHGYAVVPRWIMRVIGRVGNRPAHQLLYGLSPREFEVLCHLADGMTTTMLAGRIGISEKTVRNHIANMYAKLGLRGRPQLVRYAIEKGLARTPTPTQDPGDDVPSANPAPRPPASSAIDELAMPDPALLSRRHSTRRSSEAVTRMPD